MSSKIKRDPSVTQQQRMVIDIIHTANWLDDRISAILKRYGITHPQFNILKNIEAAQPEPLSVKEIKQSIMFKNPDVTRLVDRLVNKGLLERKICMNNRRKMDVSITQRGIDLLREVLFDFRKEFGNFFEKEVDVEEAKETSEILRRIRK